VDYEQYIVDRIQSFTHVGKEASCSMHQDPDSGGKRVFIQIVDGRRQGSRAVKIEIIRMKGWVSTPNCESSPVHATLWLLETKDGEIIVRTEVLHDNELTVEETVPASEFSTVALHSGEVPAAFLPA